MNTYKKSWQILFFLIRFFKIDIIAEIISSFLNKSRKYIDSQKEIEQNLKKTQKQIGIYFIVPALDLLAKIDVDQDKYNVDKWAIGSKYKFSQIFFRKSHAALLDLLISKYFRGRSINYLEVGAFEGFSAIWLAENILIHHPDSEATMVSLDNYHTEVLKENLVASKTIKYKLLLNNSFDQLAKFDSSTFDLVYVDAGHCSQSVMRDSILAWRALKVGGIMLFDDYILHEQIDHNIPQYYFPFDSINMFIYCFYREIEILHVGSTVAIRKKKSPEIIDFPVFGNYILFHFENVILDSKNDIKIYDEKFYKILLDEVNLKWKNPLEYKSTQEFLDLLSEKNISIDDCYY